MIVWKQRQLAWQTFDLVHCCVYTELGDAFKSKGIELLFDFSGGEKSDLGSKANN